MAWRGSLSRSFLSTATPSLRRSSQPISKPRRLRLPLLTNPRRNFFSNPRTLGALGCAQSMIPLYSVASGTRLTPHLTVNVRACHELFQGNDREEWKRWVISAALTNNHGRT